MRLTKVNMNKIGTTYQKMNEVTTIGEKNAMNSLRHKLWVLADELQDIARRPSMVNLPIDRIAKELKETINYMPIVE